jgi:hypothetical protein
LKPFLHALKGIEKETEGREKPKRHHIPRIVLVAGTPKEKFFKPFVRIKERVKELIPSAKAGKNGTERKEKTASAKEPKEPLGPRPFVKQRSA